MTGLKDQCFGVEVEMTGITREQAAQALADYLGVERSAMSTEIGKLKNSGQIDTKGAWFCIKQAGSSTELQ